MTSPYCSSSPLLSFETSMRQGQYDILDTMAIFGFERRIVLARAQTYIGSPFHVVSAHRSRTVVSYLDHRYIQCYLDRPLSGCIYRCPRSTQLRPRTSLLGALERLLDLRPSSSEPKPRAHSSTLEASILDSSSSIGPHTSVEIAS